MEWVELLEIPEKLACSPIGEGLRAKHKPLLFLWALARWHQAVYELRIDEWAKAFSEQLRFVANPPAGDNPQMPFWRLQNDTRQHRGSLWQVIWDRPDRPEEPSLQELIEAGAIGSFTEPVQSLLREDPNRVAELADRIMDHHFPEGELYSKEQRIQIRAEVGL